MAKLPTRESLGGLPSIPNTPIATFDTTAIGKGAASIGPGLEKIAAAAAHLSTVNDQAEEFETERRFQEFKWQQQKDLDDSIRSIEPGKADGFANSWTDGYKGRAKAFSDTVPEKLRPKYAVRLLDTERGLYGDAATFARGEQKRTALASIEADKSNQYYPRARAGEPLDRIGEDFKTVIHKNPFLTPIEKDIEIRKGYGDLEEAHIMGRVDRGDDVQSIFKDIRGTRKDGAVPAKTFESSSAAISTELETGKRDPLEGVANISRDSGGTKSYGNFGLNSGGSAQKFAAEYGKDFGLTAKPGTASFDEQWRNAASASPVELHDAEMRWYEANITAGIGEKLTRAGVPKELADDPRVKAYFADRSVQQGEGSIDAAAKHKARIKAAADAAGGDPVKFLQAVTEADRGNLYNDFPTALKTGVYSEEGHANRLNGRLKLSLEIGGDGAQLPAYDGPYRNLSPKRRMELENKIKTTVSEKTQQELRDAAEEIRRTGQVPRDDQGRTALERAGSLLTKNQIEKAKLDWTEAQIEFNVLHDLDTLPERDLQDRLDQVAPKSGDDLFAIRQKVFDKALTRANHLRDDREKDPAKSVSMLPAVIEATNAARSNPDDPDAVQNLVRTRIDAQGKVGVPENLRSPVTRSEARIIMAPTKGLEGKALLSAMGEIRTEMEAKYGPYARAAMISAIDYTVHGKELAEEMEGIVTKLMSGQPATAARQRRIEYLGQNAEATRAFGGDLVGDAFRQFPAVSASALDEPKPGWWSGPSGDARFANPQMQKQGTMPFQADLMSTRAGLPPPARAIAYLMENPSMADQFDAKYGVGSAAQFLAPSLDEAQQQSGKAKAKQPK